MDKKVLNELKKIYSNDVLYKAEDLYSYSYDTSPNPKEIILPEFVVFPKSAQDIVKTLKLCEQNNLALVARGAGTAHCGACRITQRSIVAHFSKMDNVIKINKENLTVEVEPNVVIQKLNDELEKYNLFFPPDPSNLAVSTIGGAIALNSGGPRTFKYGNTKDYVINLEVVLSNGEIINTGLDVAKNVAGYNLTSLFVGSEGTLGIITKATLKLIPKPQAQNLILAYFDKMQDATFAFSEIIKQGFMPSVVDLLDNNTLATIENFNPCNLLTHKKAALLIEIDGNIEGVKYEGNKILELLKSSNATDLTLADTKEKQAQIWKARRSAFAAVAKIKPNVITEDVVVPRDKIVELIDKIEKLAQKYNITTCIMGHISDGNIHPNFALNLSDENEKKNFALLKDELFSTAIALGGSISGEHGIGTEKKKYLKDNIGSNTYNLMKKIKNLLDEKNILNPDKML